MALVQGTARLPRFLSLLLAASLVLAPACRRRPKTSLPPVPQGPPAIVTAPETGPEENPEPSPAPGAGVAEQPPQPPEISPPAPPSVPPFDAQPPVAAPPPPTPPPAAPPRLAPLLPAGDQQRYAREIDASLARARENVAAAQRRELNRGQQSALNRIRAFIAQAESLRSTDLVTANALAARAALLSDELLRTSR